jgi:hypothetical protein
MKLIKAIAALVLGVPLIIVLAIVMIAYHAWIAYHVWNILAVPNGMIAIPYVVWVAAALIHSAVFSTSYSTLFPKETDEDKKRHKNFMIEEMLAKPILILVMAHIVRMFIT